MSNPQLVDQFGRPLAYWGPYEAARYSRDRTYLPYYVTDSSKTLTPFTRKQMISHARFLYINVGFVKGAIDDIAIGSIGTGIGIWSEASDSSIREIHDEYWSTWMLDCHLGPKQPFSVICKNASRAVDADGDIGCVYTSDENGSPKIQMVEAHRIDDCTGSTETQDGVIVDRYNRPVAYRVQNGDDPKDPDQYIDVPANRFSLLYDPERTDKNRSESALHHAINNARDELDLLNFEKAAVKVNSIPAMGITSAQGDVGPGFFGNAKKVTNSDGTEAFITENLRKGAIVRLKPGEEFWSHASNRPSPTFQGFLDYIDTDVAMGLNLPVAYIKAFTKGGGTLQRFIITKAQHKFADRQFNVIIPWIRRVRFYVIGMAIANGEIPESEDWYKVRIQTPAKATVDFGREAQQNRADIVAGIRSLSEDAEERGTSLKELRDDKQKEAIDLLERADEIIEEIKEKTGREISLEMAINLLQQNSPNGNMPPAQQNQSEDPENGEPTDKQDKTDLEEEE